jgi:hypothetical protein
LPETFTSTAIPHAWRESEPGVPQARLVDAAEGVLEPRADLPVTADERGEARRRAPRQTQRPRELEAIEDLRRLTRPSGNTNGSGSPNAATTWWWVSGITPPRSESAR